MVDHKYMYVMGGLVRTGGALAPTNSFFRYNTENGEVQTLSVTLSNPTSHETHVPPLSHHTMSYTQGAGRDHQSSYLYVFGGKTRDDRPSGAMYRFSLRDNRWMRIAQRPPCGREAEAAAGHHHHHHHHRHDAPCARFSHACVVVDSSKLFVFGGETTTTTTTATEQASRLRNSRPTSSSSSSPAATTTTSIKATASAASPQTFQHEPVYLNDLYIFDTHSHQWTEVRQQQQQQQQQQKSTDASAAVVPAPRSGHTWTLYGTDAYLFGGGNSETLFNDLLRLHLDSLTWHRVEISRSPSSSSSSSSLGGSRRGKKSKNKPLRMSNAREPTKRMHHSASVVGDKLIIFGGIGARKEHADIENEGDLMVFCLDKHLWNPNALREHPVAQKAHVDRDRARTRTTKAARGHTNTRRHLVDATSVLYPPCLYGHSGVCTDGKLWIFGGQYQHQGSSSFLAADSAALLMADFCDSPLASYTAAPHSGESEFGSNVQQDTLFQFDEVEQQQEHLRVPGPRRSRQVVAAETAGNIDHFSSGRYLFTLDTNIRVLQPIAVGRSTLPTDLGSLLRCGDPNAVNSYDYQAQYDTMIMEDGMMGYDEDTAPIYYRFNTEMNGQRTEFYSSEAARRLCPETYEGDRPRPRALYQDPLFGWMVSDLVLRTQHSPTNGNPHHDYHVHMAIIGARCRVLYQEIVAQIKRTTGASKGYVDPMPATTTTTIVMMEDILQSLRSKRGKRKIHHHHHHKNSESSWAHRSRNADTAVASMTKTRQQVQSDDYERHHADDPLTRTCMAMLLEFIYTDQVQDLDMLSYEAASQLSYVAQLLQLDRLYSMCHVHTCLSYGLDYKGDADDTSDHVTVLNLSVSVPPPTLFNDMKSLWYQTFQFSRQATINAASGSLRLSNKDQEETSDEGRTAFNSSEYSLSLSDTHSSPSFSDSFDSQLTWGLLQEAETGGRHTSSPTNMEQSNTASSSSSNLSAMDTHSSGSSAMNVGCSIGTVVETAHDLSPLDAFDKALKNNHCDVMFRVEHERIYAHRCVLLCRSHYFRDLLLQQQQHDDSDDPPVTEQRCDPNGRSHPARSDILPEIKIDGVRPQVFKLILEFVYTGSCDDIGFDFALELLIASEVYSLPRLSLMCQQLIERKMHVHNACRILSIAHKFEISHLRASSVNFIVVHFSQVRKTSAYKRELSADLKFELKHRRRRYRDEISGRATPSSSSSSSRTWMTDITASGEVLETPAPPLPQQQQQHGTLAAPAGGGSFAVHIVDQIPSADVASSPSLSSSPMQRHAFFASKYSKRLKHKEREKKKKRKAKRAGGNDPIAELAIEVCIGDGDSAETDESNGMAAGEKRRRAHRHRRPCRLKETGTELDEPSSKPRHSGNNSDNRSFKRRLKPPKYAPGGTDAKSSAIVHAIDSPVRQSYGGPGATTGLPRKGSQYLNVSVDDIGDSLMAISAPNSVTDSEYLEMEQIMQHIGLQHLQFEHDDDDELEGMGDFQDEYEDDDDENGMLDVREDIEYLLHLQQQQHCQTSAPSLKRRHKGKSTLRSMIANPSVHDINK